MKYYPVYLNLNGKKAVVVGGGKVAERKVLTLIKAGADVKVISPRITKALGGLRKKGLLSHIKRQYRKGDLKNAFIVIAGTSSNSINTKIARDAKQLINVVDVPSEGNFIAPSILRRGSLMIAISTGGCSPAVSRAIKIELQKLYGTEFTHYLKALRKIRNGAMERIKDNKKREVFLRQLASEKVFNKLRKDGVSSISRLTSYRIE